MSDSHDISVISSISLLELAHQEYQRGDYENAERHCMQLFNQKDTSNAVLLLLASIHFQCNRLEESESFSKIVLQRTPLQAETYFHMGNICMRRGQPQIALENFQIAIEIKPGYIDAYVAMAETFKSINDTDKAILAYVTALRYHPKIISIRIDLGNLLKSLKRIDEARACYLKVIEIKFDSAIAWNHLGCIYNMEQEYWLAIHHFEKACLFDPTLVSAFLNLGNTFKELNILDRATVSFLRILKLEPENAVAHVKLASVYYDRGFIDEAITRYRRAIELQPNLPDAYSNLGVALSEQKQYQEAEECYKFTLSLNPAHADAINNMGTIKKIQGDKQQAAEFYKKAIDINPDFPQAHNNFACILNERGNHAEAIYHFKEAVRLLPTFADAYSNMGNVLKEVRNFDGALEFFSKAIEINPKCIDAYLNIANLYNDLGNTVMAIEYYKKTLSLNPDHRSAFCWLSHCMLLVCDWIDYEIYMKKAVAIVKDQIANDEMPSIHPHHSMLYPLTLSFRKTIAQRCATQCMKNASVSSKEPYIFSRRYKTHLRIGYVSSDFGDHPTSHLMQSIPGLHDKEYFIIYCYALSSDDDSTFRQKISSECDHFIEMTTNKYSNREAADRIYADKIDILINLNVYTKGARNEIFALKPAPIQVSWLGYPGTSGSSFIDYVITDGITTPIEFAHQYSEKLAYMPETYFIGDHKQMFPHLKERLIFIDTSQPLHEVADNVAIFNAGDLTPFIERDVISEFRETFNVDNIERCLKVVHLPGTSLIDNMITYGQKQTFIQGILVTNGLVTSHTELKAASGEEAPKNIILTTRQQYGIPETAIVFCNFNQHYKINPSTLEMWVHILNKVPNSILWLLRFPPQSESNILAAATKFGLLGDRILFTDVSGKEEHVRRGQLADACLDTMICNGHTTTMDILWAGTPVVTLLGESSASRVSASLLTTLCCPELIAHSTDEYQDIAIKLGVDRDYLKAMRDKVWWARASSHLFNCKFFTRNLELLYMAMWKKFESGREPNHIIQIKRDMCI